jgi:arginyl-tRNA synthetase
LSSPKAALDALLRGAIERALGAEHAGADPLLRRSTHADFQANCALALQKVTKQKPRDLAQRIVDAMGPNDVVERVEIAGPGFLNLTLTPAALSRAARAQHASARLGVGEAASPEVVVIDYSSPNAAKEMHVGHLRSTILGDTLRRVLTLRGHRVIAQNHMGDWGTPFGMLIEHLLDVSAGAHGDASELNAFYKQARAKFDGSPEFAERSRRRVVALQAGDPSTLELWSRLVDESKRHMAHVYARLGVLLAEGDIVGESFFNRELPALAADLEAQGLARVDQGALCFFPEGFKSREGTDLPLIVRKQDGGYGYATTDLAAIRHRIERLGGTRLLYVVGSPQAQHLAMIFKAAEMAGWLRGGARAEHVQFGSVLGPDGKMFKTRDGETVRLTALLDEGRERAKAKIQEKADALDLAAQEQGREATVDDRDLDAVAAAVALAAIKYADLSADRIKDYTFDWDRMLSPLGNTGPYLQYAHARTCSIRRRAGGDESGPMVATAAEAIAIVEPAERALVLALSALEDAVVDVESTLEPHRLCTYLYELASAFSTFFAECPVLKADPAVRASRLALVELTGRVLARGLDLLGIAALERM